MAFDGADATKLCSVDAEQAVIGAVLYDNAIFNEVAAIVRADHFSEPVHSLIWETIAALVGAGRLAGVLTVDAALSGTPGYAELGRKYIEACAASSPGHRGALDYAELVAEYSARREMLALCEEMAARAKTGGIADPIETQIADMESRLRKLGDKGSVKTTAMIGADADAFLDEAENADGRIKGISTGLSALDALTGGFQPGCLFTLAGRASMGKTACALGLARGVLVNGYAVHMASLEMDRKPLWARMLSDFCRDGARIPYSDIGRRRIFGSDADLLRDANEVIKALPFSVDDASGLTADQVALSARRAARKFEARGIRLGLVIVDYLQFMAMDRAFINNPTIAVGQQTKAMKRLAKELGCTVLLLSQLNRAVENRESKRPNMADLRQSGEIEQDSDIIGFLLRPEYYVERDEKSTDEDRADARGVLQLFIDKNRNGPLDRLTLDCDIACNAVRDRGVLFLNSYGGGMA